MRNNRCETCLWWGAERAHKPEQPYGTCRVTPPQPLGGLTLENRSEDGLEFVNVTRGGWPWTAFDEWCGSFAVRPSPSPPRSPPIGVIRGGAA